jgi:single-strand DNA-binding protein
MSLNRVVLIGRLTRDPEFRTTSTGKNYAVFGIAVTKRFKPQDPNERDADFFNIKVWGQPAEYVKNYLTKGRLVSVDGRLETRRYTDQQGVTKDLFEIIAENVNGLDRPKDEVGGGSSGGYASSGGSAPRSSTPAEDEYDPFADE